MNKMEKAMYLALKDKRNDVEAAIDRAKYSHSKVLPLRNELTGLVHAMMRFEVLDARPVIREVAA